MVGRQKKASALSGKQHEAPVKRINWSIEEKMELIAWLDHSVKHKAISFDDTVIDHLKQACDSDYTIKQVKEKLKALWTNIGQNSYPNQKSWEDVFDHGSKTFILTVKETESIDQARKRIEEQATTALLETPRRTRGDSRPGDCRLSPFFSLETVPISPKRQHHSLRAQDGSVLSPVTTGGTKRPASHNKRKMPRPKKVKKSSPSVCGTSSIRTE
jgi:hypothetical protein